MDDHAAALLDCPYCDSEVQINVRAEVGDREYEDVTVIEALLCDYQISGRAFYNCECGYQETLDPDVE